jgi:membrane protein
MSHLHTGALRSDQRSGAVLSGERAGDDPTKGVAARFWAVLRQSFRRFSDSDGVRLAASMSFYAAFSLAPMLLVFWWLAGHALGDPEALRAAMLEWAATARAEGMPNIALALKHLADLAPSSTVVGVGGFATLAGASGYFNELDAALTSIFEAQPRRLGFLDSVRDFVRDRLLGYLMVALTSVAMLVTTIGRAAFHIESSLSGLTVLGSFASLATGGVVLTICIASCYRLLPRVHVGWASAWKGALVASLALHAAREPFAWFVLKFTTYATSGVPGIALALLSWFQVAASILFFGACLAAESSKSRAGEGHPAPEG